METVIYYFSGRGNSLSIARGLAQRLGGARVQPMAQAQGQVELKEERVGLVLPVIDFGIPRFVRNFVKRLRYGGKPPYVFAVITCGGMPGASALQLKRLLGSRGLPLAFCRTVVFGLEKWTQENWAWLLDKLAEAAGAEAREPLPKISFLHRLMTGLGNPLARLMIPGEDRKFLVDGKCTGCGTCAKVCPAANIILHDGKPVWLHRCEQCAACFSWCPNAAISGKCLAARTHYTNPAVKLTQMTGEE